MHADHHVGLGFDDNLFSILHILLFGSAYRSFARSSHHHLDSAPLQLSLQFSGYHQIEIALFDSRATYHTAVYSAVPRVENDDYIAFRTFRRFFGYSDPRHAQRNDHKRKTKGNEFFHRTTLHDR